MVRVTESPTNQWQTISKELIYDIQRLAETGLSSAASRVPGFIASNFDAQGARGGQARWERLTFRSIECRQTYPHGASASEQLAYFRSHMPLIDTGALRGSFYAKEPKWDGVKLEIVITTNLKYGFKHEIGIGEDCHGQPIWARPHMYIVQGDDTGIIDSEFEAAFNE